MDPLIGIHRTALEEVRRDIITMIAAMTDDQINATVPGLTNTVAIIVRHLAGSEQYWIGEVVGGRPAHRNRDAEFGRDRQRRSDVQAEFERVGTLTGDVLGVLGARDLATEVEVRRMTGTSTQTKGYAVVHAVAHMAYHQGQLKLFAKLLAPR